MSDPAPALSLSVTVVPEAAGDAAAVERLAERAFGPGRFVRTSYRLREVAEPDWTLCFVARVSTLLVGANRMTPIRIGEAPALMLGPLTVDPAFRGRGIGAGLVARSLEAARAAGHGLVMLVGDEPYYRRFGFARPPAGRLVMPGPVDAARVLWCELAPGASGAAAGAVGADGLQARGARHSVSHSSRASPGRATPTPEASGQPPTA